MIGTAQRIWNLLLIGLVVALTLTLSRGERGSIATRRVGQVVVAIIAGWRDLRCSFVS